MVPTTNAGSVGLRDLITSKQVKEVYAILKSRDIPRDTQTWNRRYREYMEKIKTGSVFEIAEVLRDLSVLRATKDLSFGERKMLETARGHGQGARPRQGRARGQDQRRDRCDLRPSR